MNKTLLHTIQLSLSQAPVQKAWLFGAFARNEETVESDIDILVEFISGMKISLFDYGAIVYDLEQATGYKIDFVQDGMFKSFARKSVGYDKILIYERKTA
ncbi:MAG: nucleotidyltransferase domain-containing protein [Prevotellaceae bacterium]|jgi:predicted nucleotidyltransferase|nr:nucleotidyltransferase domain-containing protein [Prevotellaceae bacterium]